MMITTSQITHTQYKKKEQLFAGGGFRSHCCDFNTTVYYTLLHLMIIMYIGKIIPFSLLPWKMSTHCNIN